MYAERTPYIHRHVVCVCVSQSKRENHPFPQEGGWEIEWPYIHKGENHPVPQGGEGGGFSFLPGPHGGGRGCTKPRRWGRGCCRSRGNSCSTGQNRRRYPVPQRVAGRIHHDIHYFTYGSIRRIRVHNRIPWRGGGGGPPGRNHIYYTSLNTCRPYLGSRKPSTKS